MLKADSNRMDRMNRIKQVSTASGLGRVSDVEHPPETCGGTDLL
jgi:hypothetical protein